MIVFLVVLNILSTSSSPDFYIAFPHSVKFLPTQTESARYKNQIYTIQIFPLHDTNFFATRYKFFHYSKKHFSPHEKKISTTRKKNSRHLTHALPPPSLRQLSAAFAQHSFMPKKCSSSASSSLRAWSSTACSNPLFRARTSSRARGARYYRLPKPSLLARQMALGRRCCR